jgi:hypothetical protein
MPIDVVEADRNRVLGVLVAYIRGVVSVSAVYGAIRSSSFRNQDLELILTQAELGAKDVGGALKEDMMGTLRDGLKERGFLQSP